MDVSCYCRDCEAAAKDKLHVIINWSCMACRARHVSRTPYFFEASRAGRLNEGYRRLLQVTGLTHEAVKEAAGL